VAKSIVDQHIQNLGDQTPRDLHRADVGLDVDQRATALCSQPAVPTVFDLVHQWA